MSNLSSAKGVQQVRKMHQERQMMSDPTIRIGDAAKKILQEDSVRQAFDDLKSSLVQQWIAGKTPEDRESCWNAYHAVVNLHNELSAQVQRSIRRKKQTKVEE
jgi:hypothetical protein